MNLNVSVDYLGLGLMKHKFCLRLGSVISVRWLAVKMSDLAILLSKKTIKRESYLMVSECHLQFSSVVLRPKHRGIRQTSKRFFLIWQEKTLPLMWRQITKLVNYSYQGKESSTLKSWETELSWNIRLRLNWDPWESLIESQLVTLMSWSLS